MQICSRCYGKNDRALAGRYCRGCHAAYMRAWRKTHPLSAKARRKDIARSTANVAKRRGRLVPQPCQCGSPKTEMHHPDYARPLDVIWLCRPCHLDLHAQERASCG